MILKDELDLKILKMYTCIPKMNFLGQGFQTFEHYRQTDGQMRPNVLLRRIRAFGLCQRLYNVYRSVFLKYKSCLNWIKLDVSNVIVRS